MGAPAIYHIPNRRRSGCSAVINNATNTSNTGVNGIDRRILNYDKYLKVVTDQCIAMSWVFSFRNSIRICIMCFTGQ